MSVATGTVTIANPESCPEAAAQALPGTIKRFLVSFWPVLALLGCAALLRFWDVTQWSLWEDEETTVYFSQQLARPFPSFFPIHFTVLAWLYDLTGVSVAAGRILAAALGVVNIGLVYVCFRPLVGRPAALLAALFLTINLGHLFWSQSIRYFMLALTFQLLCAYWFLSGLERKSYLCLCLSNVALVFALLTHFSAVLLVPVILAYLGLMVLRHESSGGYGWKAYLIFLLPFFTVLALFAKRFLQLRGILADMPLASARDPIHLTITTAAYFGLPVIGLGLLYPLLAFRSLSRAGWFLLLLAIVPFLELVVIALLNMANVTWYYGLVSLLGFVGLGSLSLVHLYRNYRPAISVLLAVVGILYYLPFLAGYYTTMHGDRPRWKDAAEYVKHEANVDVTGNSNPAIFANVPGVVAYYLGVKPAETMGNKLVVSLPKEPPTEAGVDQWYVVEAGHASHEYSRWLEKHCALKATFAARTGPVDRTLAVFHCSPSTSHSIARPENR